MSANTKIVVLKSKELIYTGIFVVLGILLILLLFYMFSPKDSEAAKTSTETDTSTGVDSVTTYSPGVYTAGLSLGGSNLEVVVTVDEHLISHIDINNLDETIAAMYPLLTPSLDEINSQIATIASIDEITYNPDNQYTTVIILEAVKEAIAPAIIKTEN